MPEAASCGTLTEDHVVQWFRTPCSGRNQFWMKFPNSPWISAHCHVDAVVHPHASCRAKIKHVPWKLGVHIGSLFGRSFAKGSAAPEEMATPKTCREIPQPHAAECWARWAEPWSAVTRRALRAVPAPEGANRALRGTWEHPCSSVSLGAMQWP